MSADDLGPIDWRVALCWLGVLLYCGGVWGGLGWLLWRVVA